MKDGLKSFDGDENIYHSVVGMGSNLGDREAVLRSALLHLMDASEIQVQRYSWVYETVPEGSAKGAFLNACVLVAHPQGVDSLWPYLQSVERSHGRVRKSDMRRMRWSDRTLDLDVLWSDAASGVHTRVPHIRLLERAFALRPLLDVKPDLQAQWGALCEKLDELNVSGVHRIAHLLEFLPKSSSP